MRNSANASSASKISGLLLSLVMASTLGILPARGAERDTVCADTTQERPPLAAEHIGDDTVFFRSVPPKDAGQVTLIEVVRESASPRCRFELIDRYEEEGGEPRLEATFVHTVNDEPNLFAIVSWPLQHAGLGMRGTYYAVHAYRPANGTLVANDVVMKNRELHGGVVGQVDGESSTFEGTTQEGVVAMLERLGLD